MTFFFRLVFASWFVAVLSSGSASAQTAGDFFEIASDAPAGSENRPTDGNDSEITSSISLANLPKPPEKIEKLLQLGKVKFVSGYRKKDSQTVAGAKLSAATTYKLHYDYHSRTRWVVRNDRGGRKLRITVRYTNVEFHPSHEVWFRRQPQTDGYWKNKLVLHELDHVKISSDPALEGRFRELLRNNAVIEKNLAGNVTVNDPYIDRLVDQHTEKLFQRISELIAIRYRELDRVTRHGLDPLPESSQLHKFLRGK